MKGRLAIIALGAIALMANEASARTNSHHRATGQTQVRHAPGVFTHTYGYVPLPGSQNESLRDRYQNIYESDSLGRQSFPNPDREIPPPHE
jgi:hypothetical protein